MKKKLGLLFGIAILMLNLVSATTTTLSDPELAMGYSDVRAIEFCNVNGPTMDVLISPICRDENSIFGCQAEDTLNPAGFNVLSNMSTLMVGECTALILTTNLATEDGGVFYYTANGQVGGTTVGSETGMVFVPEFTTISAGLLLLGAGTYILKKRKEK